MTAAPRRPLRHRLRRAAKWAGLVTVATVLALWTASGWWMFQRAWYTSGSTTGIVLGCGQVEAFSVPGQYWSLGPNLWQFNQPLCRRWRWGFESGWDASSRAAGKRVAVPMWAPWVVVLIPTALLWHLDRRRFAPGRCQRCGYDLAGLAPGAPCPECGKGATA